MILKKDIQDKESTKYGAIIRTGDLIKFGRIYIIIKESSIDKKKILKLKNNICGESGNWTRSIVDNITSDCLNERITTNIPEELKDN